MSRPFACIPLVPMLLIAVTTPLFAQSASITPQQAFAKGCGGCHSKESAVLSKIPRLADNLRRAWLIDFMTSHPCEADSLKPLIVDYLMTRTGQ